jgi:hypothetical protein
VVEKSLQNKLIRIFDIAKVTFDEPGESREQNCLFLDVETTRFNYTEGYYRGKLTGKATMFAPNDKLPLGYFAKRVRLADPADTKDLFFTFEESSKMYQNIVQRSFTFVYLFNGQYDPETGSIESVTFSEE